MSLTNETQQRGLRDFLQLYNTITGFCFDKCISNFNANSSTPTEVKCVDVCTDNYVQFNQRLMFNFMDHQERRKRDQENAAIELAAKEAAAASQSATNEESTVILDSVESSSLKSDMTDSVLQNSNIQSSESISGANSLTFSNGPSPIADLSKTQSDNDSS